MMIFILVYMPNLLKVSECKHTTRVFCYDIDLKFELFRFLCKFVFTEFLTTWVWVEILLFDSKMFISSIF